MIDVWNTDERRSLREMVSDVTSKESAPFLAAREQHGVARPRP